MLHHPTLTSVACDVTTSCHIMYKLTRHSVADQHHTPQTHTKHSHLRSHYMSVLDATTPLEVYTHCSSYTQLLGTDTAAVTRLRGTLRQWKKRKQLPTLEDAFQSYYKHLLTTNHINVQPQHATSSQSASAAQESSLTPPLCASPQQPIVSHDKLVHELAELRGLIQQHRTPTPLKTKLIDRKYRSHLHVLSIVGDGRCLFYSLLQSQRAMLPTAYEADELRAAVKYQLLNDYTDDEWEARVPIHMRDVVTRQQFADNYLSRATTHVPHDTIALWQDSPTGRAIDVYVIESTPHGEKIESVRSSKPSEGAMVLYFSYFGVGHYELVTFNDVIVLPTTHEFVQHLDRLHEEYVDSLSKEERRAAAQRKGKRQRTDDAELVE